MKIINSILYTIRPSATIGACLLVLAAFEPSSDELWPALILFLCTFFGASYCFMINDIIDRAKDRLNNKNRPLATGELSVTHGYAFAFIFALLFVILSYQFGKVVFLLSFVFLTLTTAYSFINVKTGLLANAIVAFIVSGTQWGVAFIKPDSFLIYSSLFLFFFTIPREILLDILDKSGDEAFGKNSLAIKFSTSQIVRAIILCLTVSSLVFMPTIIEGGTILSTVLFILTIVSAWLSFFGISKERIIRVHL